MIHFDPPWPQNDPEWRPGGKGSAAGGLARAVEPENGLKSSLGGAEKLVQGPSSEGYYSFEFPTRDASKSLDFGN